MPPKGSGKKNDAGAAGSSSTKPVGHKEKLAIEVRILSHGESDFNDMA